MIWDEEGATLIDEDFIRMLLVSLCAPEPPKVLPVSDLFGDDAPDFDIERVLKITGRRYVAINGSV